MREKYKKGCRALNYSEYFLTFISVFSQCVSISAFGSLASVPVGKNCSTVKIKICAIRGKKHDKNSVASKNHIKCNRSFNF